MKRRHIPFLLEGTRQYDIYFDLEAYNELLEAYRKEHADEFDDSDEEHPRVLAFLESEPGCRIIIHPLLLNLPAATFQSILHEAIHIAERRTGITLLEEPHVDAFALALADVLIQSDIVRPAEMRFGTLVNREDGSQ